MASAGGDHTPPPPPPPLYNHRDLDPYEACEPFNDVVGIPDVDDDDDNNHNPNHAPSSDSDPDDVDAYSISSAVPTPAAGTVTLAIPVAIRDNGVSAITTTPFEPKRQRFDELISAEKKPIDDSRKLFQRLWTDEDEIELLQGFLDYTVQRGTAPSGHYDTTAFYEQIRSRLQLDFNKNQLVEKLRRLKKKYRTVVSKMSSGKDFVFKSPHDQATFEISRKIWSDWASNRPEFDEEDHQNPNPNPNPNLNYPPQIINLNSSSYKPGGIANFDINSSEYKPGAIANLDINSPDRAAKSRKRSRPKLEEKLVMKNLNFGGSETPPPPPLLPPPAAVNPCSTVPQLIEESVKSCVTPLFKEFLNSSANGNGHGGGDGPLKGISTLTTNAVPLNFTGLNLGRNGEPMDEKWRKQMVLELEVYSKRLALVQDQINSALDELRSIGS